MPWGRQFQPVAPEDEIMTFRIRDIQGIGPVHAAKLAIAGITSTGDLLALGCTATGRQKVAEITGLSEGHILKWANMADLMRISGVGSEYSELLEAAGVDTVKELRNRNATNLAAKMKEVNEDKELTRTVPGEGQVVKWVEQAKELEVKITY